ncbi:MAG: hypothetical protein O7C59_08350, partial [Rickettsia endosymbiont of Ixodes persulcatus]|nr:hypothetical protein [Rickettsia endosymbiont of Ixodes persulcatus]
MAKKLLIVTGQANRKKFSNPTNIPFRKDIYDDMEKYCSGSQIGIVNVLLRRALDSLIDEEKVIIE